ncbi:MAG: hypothetical protein IJW59_01170 [Clostridia bacterium]|nr:hypothetical protein [Clostridia bacterium]
MKKKFLSFVLTICLIIPCAFALAACGKTDSDDATAKVMNVSLNPEIEFILDKDDKVLSVNALDEDGNHIITLSIDETTEVSEFEGMTADEAVEEFLDIAEENGYLETGEEEKINIDISGNADNLMKKVKDKANNFFKDKGLNVDVVTGKIEKSDIAEKVEECLKEYSETELEEMTQEQLIDLLKDSRQETKNLLTQELKDAYYNMRVEKINIAELENLASIIREQNVEEGTELDLFADAIENLQAQITLLEEAYADIFLAEDGAYNTAKQAYIEAKEALLAKRLELGVDGLNEAEKTILEGFEDTVIQLETVLKTAKDTADLALKSTRDLVDNAFDNVKDNFDIEDIKSQLADLGVDLSELNNAKQNAKDGFKNHFEAPDKFGSHVGHDKGHWNKEQPAA